MKKSIDLTYYRRWIQKAHNETHGLTATTIFSSIKDIGIASKKKKLELSGDPKSFEKDLARLELEMDIAAANMEYEAAAEIRDQILELKKWKKAKKRK
jgi:excinuclease ABC subunit B